MVKTAVLVTGFTQGMDGCDVIDHKPIIEHSICKLLEAGMEKIIITTGQMSEVHERLSLHYPQISFICNRQFQKAGSMSILYLIKSHIREDFLLLESDLLYEKNALRMLMEDQRDDAVLACPRREELNSSYAECVGITKISYPTFGQMCAYAETVLPTRPDLDYQYVLVEIYKDIDLYVHKLQHFAWCKVNDDNVSRAFEVIYPLIQAREAVPAAVKRNRLLNPGPATTTDTVKYAQVQPDICPREQEFGEIMQFISCELTKFVADDPEEYTTVLFGGSGTAAVESILSSVVDEDTIIIVNNGAYGHRMCQIAEAYGLHYLEYKSPIDEPIDFGALAAFIQNCSHTISHLAVVHCETTTGLLNDIEDVGQLCKTFNITMIVDAMSSFAAIPIEMKKMNISYLAASSNKCLQGIAGVSFVIANKDELLSTRELKQRNFYLHLASQYEHFTNSEQMRFTPPVQTLYALKQAIIETKFEGIQNRYERYAKSWDTLIRGITRLGLSHLVDQKHHSKIITSIIEPAHSNYDFSQMHDFFYNNGFTIYPGKLDERNTFRIANIGEITCNDMEEFVGLLKQYLDGLDE